MTLIEVWTPIKILNNYNLSAKFLIQEINVACPWYFYYYCKNLYYYVLISINSYGHTNQFSSWQSECLISVIGMHTLSLPLKNLSKMFHSVHVVFARNGLSP